MDYIECDVCHRSESRILRERSESYGSFLEFLDSNGNDLIRNAIESQHSGHGHEWPDALVGQLIQSLRQRVTKGIADASEPVKWINLDWTAYPKFWVYERPVRVCGLDCLAQVVMDSQRHEEFLPENLGELQEGYAQWKLRQKPESAPESNGHKVESFQYL